MEPSLPPISTTNPPSSEERTWAALAHASILLFGFGTIAALVIWITQRKKSAYVAFQSLQALLYQALQVIIFTLLGLVIAIVSTILSFATIPLLFRQGNANFILFYLVQFIPLFLLFGLLGLYVLGGLIMAILCLTGRQAHYHLLGTRLARYLESDPGQSDERQDRVVASAAHLGAFTPFWGMLLPLIAWLSEKNRSAVLRFQCLQALAYQAIGILATIIFLFGVFIFQFILAVTATIGMAAATQSNRGWILVLILLPAVIMLLLVALWLVLGPIYQTFALVAAWQVSHDKDYRYPILGKLIAGRLKENIPATIPAPSQG